MAAYDRNAFWEQRYANGGTSGRGSHFAPLVQFKADVLNRLVAEFEVETLTDLGVGDGNQLLHAMYHGIWYLGVDISETAIARCKSAFRTDAMKHFVERSEWVRQPADMVISCDVLYHAVSFADFEEHLADVFETAGHVAVIYACDEDRPSPRQAAHVCFRKFTPYIASKYRAYELVRVERNPHKQDSPSDFYIFKRTAPRECKRVYVSLTSIYQKQLHLLATLHSMAAQQHAFDKCVVYLSRHPFLIDTGFPEGLTEPQLAAFFRQNGDKFQVCWVANTGPYRKLVPLMRQLRGHRKCTIVTIDDDCIYDNCLVDRLVTLHEAHGCCIAERVFTPACRNGLVEFEYSRRVVPPERRALYNFHTGCGGVIYDPAWFIEKVYDDMIDTALRTIPTADDICFNLLRYKAGIDCLIADGPPCYADRHCVAPHVALFHTYNKSKNTAYFRQMIHLFGLNLN